MRTTSETVRRLFGAATLLAVVLLAGGAPAFAQGELDSGDSRATAHPDNVTTCEQAGQPGSTIAPADVTYFVDITNTYITVTGLGDYEVTAVVVKGGNAYNLYPATGLGGLPWTLLHSPHNASGKPAEISHWFLCGKKVVTTTTTTTTTTATTTTTTTTPTSTDLTTTTTTTTPGSTTSSGSTNSTSSSTSTEHATKTTTKGGGPTTTTTKQPVVAGGSDKLASTGFGSMWLVFLGLGLLVIGGAFVASPKLRGLFRR